MDIRPFKAAYAKPELASRIAAVPYDVVDTAEARELARGNPLSFLHVSRAEIDMASGTDPYSEAVYKRGAEALRAFLRDGTLLRETEPQLYVYRQTMGTHTQRGIVACCSTFDYENEVIKTHEKTRQDKEDDRTRHIEILDVQSEPVFLTYRDNAELRALVRDVERTAPLFEFTAPDGIGHAMWRFPDPGPVEAAFRNVPTAYIADGHHRSAAAVRVARQRRTGAAAAESKAEYNWFLGVLFPASELQILPYNRCVRDLNGLTEAAFLDAVGKRFTVRPAARTVPEAPARVCMYLAGAWHELSWTVPPGASPVDRLDVSVLQERLLAPVLGIGDPRTNKRIDFIGGIRGAAELEKRVNSGTAAVAFSMFPTTVEQVMDIADAGGIMPPKSTWFEPKLRSGLFVHLL